MSQKYIKSQNKNSHNAKSFGKYYAKPVYDEKFVETDEIADFIQTQAMRRLLEELHARYPRAVIVGHHDLNPHKAAIKRGQNQKFLDFAEREQARPKVKDCPCIIDVASEYKDLQPK